MKHFSPAHAAQDQASARGAALVAGQAPPLVPPPPPPLVSSPPRRHSRLWLLPVLPAFLLLAGFALFAGQGRARPDLPLRPTDGIAVLTGGPERVEAGLRLLAEGYAQWLIVSGVGPRAELADLSRIAGLSSQNDGVARPPAPPNPAPSNPAPSNPATLPPTTSPTAKPGALPGLIPAALAGRVTLGRVATSTRGNGREVAEWARLHEIRSLRVVTAGYHMPRALLELRRSLPGVALVPHPVQVGGPRLALLTREYAKLLGAMAGLSALKPEKAPL